MYQKQTVLCTPDESQGSSSQNHCGQDQKYKCPAVESQSLCRTEILDNTIKSQGSSCRKLVSSETHLNFLDEAIDSSSVKRMCLLQAKGVLHQETVVLFSEQYDGICSENQMNFRSLYCCYKSILEAWKVEKIFSRRSVSVKSSLQDLGRVPKIEILSIISCFSQVGHLLVI